MAHLFRGVGLHGDDDYVEENRGWSFVVLAENSFDDFALVGVVGDVIGHDFGIDVPPRNLGLTFHSALGAEYVADVFAL